MPGLGRDFALLQPAYSSGELNVAATARWQSGAWFSDPRQFVDLRGRIPAYTYVDLAISYRTEISGHEFTPFLTVALPALSSVPLDPAGAAGGESPTSPTGLHAGGAFAFRTGGSRNRRFFAAPSKRFRRRSGCSISIVSTGEIAIYAVAAV